VKYAKMSHFQKFYSEFVKIGAVPRRETQFRGAKLSFAARIGNPARGLAIPRRGLAHS